MFFQRYKYSSYTEKRALRSSVLKVLSIILAVFTGHILLTSYVLTIYRINADTMQPTYAAGDVIITSPLSPLCKKFDRGAVVMVEPFKQKHRRFISRLIQQFAAFATFQMIHPYTAETSHIKPFVRRVVGLPGDTIYMDSFTLYVKTKDSRYFLTEFEVAEHDYNVRLEKLPEGWNKQLPFDGSYPETTLKENEYFVLCDNRIASSDSRLWGPLHGPSQIKSKVFVRYWPFSRFAFF